MASEKRLIVAYGREFYCNEEVKDDQFVRALKRIDFDGPNGCWIWTGFLNPNGYGEYAGFLAHRFIWFALRGPVREGIHLHHRIEEPTNCSGPSCVNPFHLLPVTPKEHLELTPQHCMYLREWKADECPKGHPLTPDNIYWYPNSKKRRCRACFNEWQTQRVRAQLASREPIPERTHCGKGHILDEANTYNYNGLRYCRACHADLTARQYHERKAAAGFVSSKRVLFSEKKVCNAGHDLTDTANVMSFNLHGQPKQKCRACHVAAHKSAYAARQLKYKNEPRPERRKPGPKPRVAVAS